MHCDLLTFLLPPTVCACRQLGNHVISTHSKQGAVLHFPEAPETTTYSHPPLRYDAIFALLEGGFRRKCCDGYTAAAKKRWDKPKRRPDDSDEWYLISCQLTVKTLISTFTDFTFFSVFNGTRDHALSTLRQEY